MNAVDDFGEPLVHAVPLEESLVPHVRRYANGLAYGGAWCGVASLWSFVAGVRRANNCGDPEEMTVHIAAGVAGAVLALLRTGRFEQSRFILEDALFHHPEETIRAFDTAYEQATSDLGRGDINYAGKCIIDAVMRRVQILLRDTGGDENDAHHEQSQPEESPHSNSESALNEYIPDAIDVQDIPLHLLLAADTPTRVDLEYELAMSIRNEQTNALPSKDVLRGRLRSRVVEACAINDRLLPQVMGFFGGEMHLKPILDEYYRHQKSLIFLYGQCVQWDDLADLRAMHEDIEERFALEIAGSGDVPPEIRERMHAELSLIGQLNDAYEKEHHWKTRTRAERHVLEEMERHITVLTDQCSKAKAELHLDFSGMPEAEAALSRGD